MLQIDGVTKTYGTRAAVSDVTFGVGAGRITGFVGANGAGKTTTMRIMLGVLSPDSGEVSLDGKRLTPADRRIFGYMPEERGLYPKMKVAEQIVYFGRLHGMSAPAAKKSTDDLLERLELTERSGDLVEALSLGNQQRAQIAAALVHHPEVLVLDEPFSGLDPIAVETVLTVLKDTASTGAPVLFSSHQLELVERLCDDLVIIAQGRVKANGSRDDLRAEHGRHRFEITLEGDAGWLRDVDGITVVSFEGGHAVFESPDPDAAQRVLRRALDQGAVAEFAPLTPSLSQIFKEVIQ